MEVDEIRRTVEVARGVTPPDMVLANCQLVNVITGEIYGSDILIAGRRVAATGSMSSPTGGRVLDCRGMYAVPGFIDGHMHIESSLVAPSELARVMVPRGTTAVMMDPHEVGAVLGLAGVRTFMEAVGACPFRAYLQVPSRVPQAPGLESTGGVLDRSALSAMLEWEETVSLGEVDVTKVTGLKDEYLGRIAAYRKARMLVNGCSAGVEGPDLSAYISAGIADDHGCATTLDVMNRLRLGMTSIQLRQSTSSKDLVRLINVIKEFGLSTRRLTFCDDDKTVEDIVSGGHMDENVRLAMEAGVAPIDAIQMATINCAEHFHLEFDIGAIAPGRFADILLLEGLDAFPPKVVMVNGVVVAEEGELVSEARGFEYPEWFCRTVHLPKDLSVDFLSRGLRAGGLRAGARVISTRAGDLRKQVEVEQLPVRNGIVEAPSGEGVNYLVVVNRYGQEDLCTTAFVRGFGLKRGALASSVAHDHHNAVAIGASLREIVVALKEIGRLQGAYVAVDGESVLEALPLPLAGLMSDGPFESVLEKMRSLRAAARSIGIERPQPFMDLGFLTLPTVPEVGVTDRGMVDALTQHIIPVLAQ